MIHGYARVSTGGQSVDAQVKQLRDAGAEKIFRETASGAKTERRGLARAIGSLGKGDTLLVTRLWPSLSNGWRSLRRMTASLPTL
jgi:DNA invertase Pin-like site-specific DNA recombinase